MFLKTRFLKLLGNINDILCDLSQLHICLINFLAKLDCLPNGGFPTK